MLYGLCGAHLPLCFTVKLPWPSFTELRCRNHCLANLFADQNLAENQPDIISLRDNVAGNRFLL